MASHNEFQFVPVRSWLLGFSNLNAKQAEAREEIQTEYGKPLPAPLSVDLAGMAGFLAMIGLAVPVGLTARSSKR